MGKSSKIKGDQILIKKFKQSLAPCLKKVGFFGSEFAMYHDWELRIRLTKYFRVAYCPQILCEYRRHSASISRSVPSRHLDEMERVYKKNMSLITDLNDIDRNAIEHKLYNIFKPLAHNCVVEKLNEKDRVKGYNYLKKSFHYGKRLSDLVLLFLFFIPHPIYKALRFLYRRFNKII